MNKRIYFLILLLFIGLSINAQKLTKEISLTWDNTASIRFGNTEPIQLPLLKDGLFDSHQLPIYSSKWSVDNNMTVDNYEITNITYQNIDLNLYSKDSQKYFPTRIESSFQIKSSRNKSFAIFSLTPLLLKNGNLKKITSFTITYELKNKLAHKGPQTIHDSPFASGNWYKFAISNSGIYKIDKAFLNSLGINTDNINPKDIHLYGNGGAMLPELNSDYRPDGIQENSIYIKGEADNSFDNNDYILFYAQGTNVWKTNLSNQLGQHQKNIYSDKAYYFIHIGANGKRITPLLEITGTPTNIISTSNAYQVHEIDKYNFDSIGQDFFGENFSIDNDQNFDFTLTDANFASDIFIKLKAGTSAVDTSTFTLKVNNNALFDLSIPGTNSSAVSVGNTKSTIANTTLTSENLQVNITYDNHGKPSAIAYLDYIEINYTKNLIARSKQFGFRNYNHANTSGNIINEFLIKNSSNIFQLWNITDHINPTEIINQSTDSDFKFNAESSSLQEYIIVNEKDFYTPEKLNNSRVENQNLHAIKDIDLLIITDSELTSQANRLANYHETNSNLTTLVLTEQTIYNEFSSGAKDASAIRDFIRHLYLNSSTVSKRIKYVLMLGDTSFDFKNIEGNNGDVNVIAFQSADSFNLAESYVTDDYFVMMDDNEGDFSRNLNSGGFYSSFRNGRGDLIDVAIGRMPVKNLSEATTSIDKTLNYYHKKALGDWRNQISLVADDIDKPIDFTLETGIEEAADSITKYKPVYNLKKIYADAYVQEITAGGEAYPQVNNAINNAVERGSLVIDYFGHGGENGWSEERILDVNQIQQWFNEYMSALFITITCEFSRYDNPTRKTAGEYVYTNAKGGSINMITTAREVYISFGSKFNKSLLADVLEFIDVDDFSMAQSLAKTKNKYPTQNQRFFIQFFGDPVMKLAKPKANIVIKEMNNIPITQQLDTIKALSHVYFKGIVTNGIDDATALNNFNGELSVIVFDKAVTRTTLDNDNNNKFMDFDTRESKIFNGKASVVNGEWEFDFIAPRDIRIAFGKGKLSFYAQNGILDKNGYNTDITVGGINSNAPDDDIGPTIKLYMNDESFIDGGNTNESPLFIAVLADDSGINTSLTAVDHDIVAILDGNQNNPIILNDYYETELNDFKNGKVNYPFRNLAVGPHTIDFKCWDTYNNSSEASLKFVVVSDGDLILDNVLNYPNPFINYTEFWFNHNKPNETLEAQVQIFTVSGKLIKTLNKTIHTEGTLARSITWNGLDNYGNKIGKGVYIYKLSVHVISSGLKAEKIEKLVILQ